MASHRQKRKSMIECIIILKKKNIYIANKKKKLEISPLKFTFN